jgi:Mn2+/Fe2+ NRAMP family transporter
MIVAVFGTTISPYLFFWQASQEVEDLNLNASSRPLISAPDQVESNFRRIKLDTYFGMGFSNLVAFFIILTTAVTLHLHGSIKIETSADAAKALQPIAGEFAFLLFSLGIIGTGLLAVPVLAGSSAYAIAEALDWKERSLELKPKAAKRFYSIIGISTLVGVALGFTSVDPIKALYISAVVNGVISIPIMAIMMLMAVNSEVMGKLVVRRKLQILGWLTIIVMTAAVGAMFIA